MRGVLAQAGVGQDEQVFDLALERPDGALRDAVLGEGRGPDLVLALGQPEDDHPRDAQPARLLGLLDQLVHREVEDAGH
jgi:hypothetical protein